MAKKAELQRSILAFYVVFTVWAVGNFAMPFFNGNAMMVDFIDVGQADGTLITTAGGRAFLIDAGNDDESVVQFLTNRRVRKVDVAAVSHYHDDHFGGLMDVVHQFDVDLLILPEPMSESEWYVHDEIVAAADLRSARDDVTVMYAAVGDVLKIGDNMMAEVVFWDGGGSDENERTVVNRVTGFDSRFLFTGDMGIREETDMLMARIDVDVDVVKVAHHGSRYSSSVEFLQAVSPKYAVISVGRNSYGHPTLDAIDRIGESRAEILRTDYEGTITFIVDSRGFRRREGWF